MVMSVRCLAQQTKKSTLALIFVVFGVLTLDMTARLLANTQTKYVMHNDKESGEASAGKYPKAVTSQKIVITLQNSTTGNNSVAPHFDTETPAEYRENSTTAKKTTVAKLTTTIRTTTTTSKPLTTTTTTTTTTTSKSTTTDGRSTLAGIKSMDHDLSLPPEIPERPDSKEPILKYSQKRDYPLLISHDDKCGNGPPADMSLKEFDYEMGVFLLVVVKSACSLQPRRQAIRETWGNEEWSKINLGVNVRLVFLLGACQTQVLQKEVIAEDFQHHDILQWDFFDSFRNLTLKDCLFMQWYSTNCRNVPFVFKGDDDVFVNIKNIITFLKQEVPPEKRETLFVGSVLNGSPRILDPKWKYYVSYNLYPEKYYPAYVSGGGFIMSGHMVVRLFQATLQTRIIPIDDAFLGILLKKIGESPQNDNGFKSWGMKLHDPCRLSKIKTYHKMLPPQLRESWKQVNELDLSTCDNDSNGVLAKRTKR